MTCQDVVDRVIAEDYLLGRLPDPVREEFERHYFDCDRCFAELEALRAVRSELQQRPRDRQPAAARRTRFAPHWVAAAAAILLLTAGGIIAGLGDLIATLRNPPAASNASRAPSPAGPSAAGRPLPEEVQRLARVTPPPASTTQLRSAAGSRPAFRDGMSRYRIGEYTSAIPLLERALRDEPSAEDSRFYLAASQLLTGDARRAVATLMPIADRPESSYAEESRFLIAKAYVQLGDTASATDMLNRTIEMHGEREADAARLREALSRATSR